MVFEALRSNVGYTGTGSVCYSFSRNDGSAMSPVTRRGGYGHLLGDEGSGYYIGKQAVVDVLSACEKGLPLTAEQLDVDGFRTDVP